MVATQIFLNFSQTYLGKIFTRFEDHRFQMGWNSSRHRSRYWSDKSLKTPDPRSSGLVGSFGVRCSRINRENEEVLLGMAPKKKINTRKIHLIWYLFGKWWLGWLAPYSTPYTPYIVVVYWVYIYTYIHIYIYIYTSQCLSIFNTYCWWFRKSDKTHHQLREFGSWTPHDLQGFKVHPKWGSKKTRVASVYDQSVPCC